jgi:NAD(P)H-dependent flavin oxidoreductase YrpB (nitropropane dioxygenase family)
MLPHMGAPTCDAETLAAYFHPIHPETWEDPIVGPVLRRLARIAPGVIEAVADVDRSLIFDALTWTPDARLARALGMAAFIEKTREAMGHAGR